MKKPHEDWLSYAEDDLKFAQLGLKEGFYTQVCFHSQQGIEKSLKGYLVFQKKNYPKTHGLLELARLMPELGLKEMQSQLALVEDYYVPVRYPDTAAGMKSSGPPNLEEATEALQTAKKVFEIVTMAINR
ncbi:MAG: hypothetical protein A3H42_03735 [Deltaproteobacteria bacterium RIFCSPLOWO2_02_FULL_46_8]|nr:MAG: hypothetical protein A3H42_03735 [Deltaproteobacteria bacterium RIFCSPLOWO2_02_FULL_46_8]